MSEARVLFTYAAWYVDRHTKSIGERFDAVQARPTCLVSPDPKRELHPGLLPSRPGQLGSDEAAVLGCAARDPFAGRCAAHLSIRPRAGWLEENVHQQRRVPRPSAVLARSKRFSFAV